ALAVTSSKGFKTLNIDLTDMNTELDSVYDHIVLFEVAEHIINAEILMMKLKGKYRKGLYVSTPNLGYIAHRLRLMFGRFPLTYISDPREHVRYWTVKDFLDWSDWLGFKRPQVLGIRGKIKVFRLPTRWPSLWASEVVYRFTP
ncbi:MAG: methionine biosynthesis protein MetW, partial [Candidatus Aegiribacteria sp.]|nr:methionine biosynthesis protein MetW [Candidatus Aegiribacteria sp.]